MDSGTALDVAGNLRYVRKVVIARKRERARRLHTVAPTELAELAKTDPSVLVVNDDDMRRAVHAVARVIAEHLKSRPVVAVRRPKLRAMTGLAVRGPVVTSCPTAAARAILPVRGLLTPGPAVSVCSHS
ncbi:MAG: ATPase, central domain protein [Mycobacterium sp.]|nr:ATPase, central domain protein [Mycobacterium sp.]